MTGLATKNLRFRWTGWGHLISSISRHRAELHMCIAPSTELGLNFVAKADRHFYSAAKLIKKLGKFICSSQPCLIKLLTSMAREMLFVYQRKLWYCKLNLSKKREEKSTSDEKLEYELEVVSRSCMWLNKWLPSRYL